MALPILTAKTKALEAAYRATTYRVALPTETLDLRIGQADERLVRWLLASSDPQFAIVTAHNPASVLSDEAANHDRQGRLLKQLLASGYSVLSAWNVPDTPDWPIEESFFVSGISASVASALAAEYGQNAIVCGGAEGLAQLVWIQENK